MTIVYLGIGAILLAVVMGSYRAAAWLVVVVLTAALLVQHLS